MSEQFVIRSCCRNGARVLEPVVRPDGRESRHTGEVHEVITAEPPPRDPAKAAHEAAHAAVSHAFGRQIESVRIGALNEVCHPLGARKLSLREQAVVYLAGDHGANWLSRWVCRPFDDDVLERISALKLLEIGGCDRCRALLMIAGLLGYHASPADYLKTYREIEEATLALVQRPDIMRAMRCVADRLMEVGVLDGPAAHALIEASGLPFNSIRIDGGEASPSSPTTEKSL